MKKKSNASGVPYLFGQKKKSEKSLKEEKFIVDLKITDFELKNFPSSFEK